MFPNLVESCETIRMAMEGFCLGYDIVLPIPPAEISLAVGPYLMTDR